MKILGIGSHPDDIEFGCGGTFYKLSKKGFKINMLIMTSGEMGGHPSVRAAEQRCAAKYMGSKIYWGGFRDTDVQMNRELINKIENVMAETSPDLIFTHFSDDTHQDHCRVAQATITAARYKGNVLFYEGPTTRNFVPTVFVDIGTVLQKKLQLLRCHKSQVYKTNVPNLSIIESVKSTAIFRGYQDRVKYAEAFMPQRLFLDFSL